MKSTANAEEVFRHIMNSRAAGKAVGICSVCSAHPYVIRAAMEQCAEDGVPVLIEATANQVNQFGGYTGMTPGDFSRFVYEIAQECGFPQDRIILGGDHLGPLVWKDRPESEAMPLAEELVSAYVSAGFSKIHLDTSMKLAGDKDGPPDDATIARRGARLCAAAEHAAKARHEGRGMPVYVIGSEVPVPGGPQEEVDTLAPTTPQAFLNSYRAFRDAFAEAGLSGAFSRVVAFVVQPGVEFTGDSVFDYDRAAASGLFEALRSVPGMAFEAHSTDYQRPGLLRLLVEDGASILKVGPALTFALREGLMALESIERELARGAGFTPSRFTDTLESAMLANSAHWKNHYSEADIYLQARYSYFDRARYYLPLPQVSAAVEKLTGNLEKAGIPLTLLSCYLPKSYDRVRSGEISAGPRELLRDHVRGCLRGYAFAARGV